MNDHLVRVGSVGHLGRFPSSDGVVFRRGVSVVCRTSRGLEFGSVLNRIRDDGSGNIVAPAAANQLPHAGQILRGATAEDHLLWNRLQKHRIAALDACQDTILQRNIATTLMDCEVLFDGQSIFFYFLGEISPELEALTQELADAYEAKAQLQQFADALTLGCGPDCGTDAAACSSGGCSTCSIASACKTPAG